MVEKGCKKKRIQSEQNRKKPVLIHETVTNLVLEIVEVRLRQEIWQKLKPLMLSHGPNFKIHQRVYHKF